MSSLTADVQQRALLPVSAGGSNQSQNNNQDQSSDEDLPDDTDSDEENSKKQLSILAKKASKMKTTTRPNYDDPVQGAIQVKKFLNAIFPTTQDVYGFALDEPSPESLKCYENYAKIARDACSLPSPSVLCQQQVQYELALPLNRSASSSSNFSM